MRDTYWGNTVRKSGIFVNWRASETVLGVDNAKSGICYMYICIYVCMYGLYVCPLNARAGSVFS